MENIILFYPLSLNFYSFDPSCSKFFIHKLGKTNFATVWGTEIEPEVIMKN